MIIRALLRAPCQAGLRGPRVGAPEVSHAHPCPIRAQYSRASVPKSALSRAPTVPARMDSCTADAGVRTSRANLIRRLVISLQGRAVSYSSSQKRKSRYHSCGQPGLAVNASRHRTVTRSCVVMANHRRHDRCGRGRRCRTRRPPRRGLSKDLSRGSTQQTAIFGCRQLPDRSVESPTLVVGAQWSGQQRRPRSPPVSVLVSVVPVCRRP